jgi:5-methylcytosine-specific restriction enzyme A
MGYIPNYKPKHSGGVNRGGEVIKSVEVKERSDKFYHTNNWRRLSERYRRDNPTCAQCKKNGYLSLGNLCDHIIPMSMGGSPTDERNLQTLCNRCHNKKRQDERWGKVVDSVLNDEGQKIPADHASR